MPAYNKDEKSYYKVTSHPSGNGNLTITKFDEDLEALSIYHLSYIEAPNGSYYDCACPASKFDCRHKAIVKEIQDAKMVDSDKFFSFKDRKFYSATEIE